MRIALTVLAAMSACGSKKKDPLEADFRARFPGDACKQLKVEVGDWDKLRETPDGAKATQSFLLNPNGDKRIAIIHGPYGPVCDREGLCRGQEQIEIAAWFAHSTLYGAVYEVRGQEVGSEDTLKVGCSKPGAPPDIVAEGRQKLEKLVAAGITPWTPKLHRSVEVALGKPEDLIEAPPPECAELRALKVSSSDDEFERKRKQEAQGTALHRTGDGKHVVSPEISLG